MKPASTVDDPVFGTLTYDGQHDGGWCGSFADPRFATWGQEVRSYHVNEQDEQPVPQINAQEVLDQFRSMAPPELKGSELYKSMEATLPQHAQKEASLDREADRLAKAGRFKVIVHNLRDPQHNGALQQAWRQFREGGEALYNQISERLFAIYEAQRPQRLRWWEKIYGDSPDEVLPKISRAAELHRLMWPTEFRVHANRSDSASVTIVIDALWSGWCNIEVKVRDGVVVSIDPQTDAKEAAPDARRIQSPIFGPLEWNSDNWCGTFHCHELRGYSQTLELRRRFRTDPSLRSLPRREMPEWDVITGDFALRVEGSEDAEPSPEQEAAYRDFTRNLEQNAWLALVAILNWYQQIRPNWFEQITDETELAEQEAVMPVITTPEGLLDMIQLQSLTVCEKPDDDRSPAIVLSFCWFDENGLAVRWRAGQIEDAGDWDTVAASGY